MDDRQIGRRTRSLIVAVGAAIPASFVAATILPLELSGEAARGAADRQCVIREVSRERLLVNGGQQVYVQPAVAVANARGDVLLAGQYNHLFVRNSNTHRWTIAARDSVLGAIVPHTGKPLLVRSPIPTSLLGTVRAAARPDGSWSVVFAELKPYTGEFRPDSVARLWHGIVQDGQWSALESIPLPPVGTLRSVSATLPVLHDDVLSWAAVMGTPRHPSDVIIYHHTRGEWSYEVVPTVLATYAALGYSASFGALLAVVQPDLTLPNDGNSLFVWTRRHTWQQARKVVPSSVSQVHNPQLSVGEMGAVITWEAQLAGGKHHAVAMVNALDGRAERTITLDTALVAGSRISLVSAHSLPRLWVVDHANQATGRREIRFVSDRSGRALELGRIPNPYHDSFSVASISPLELLVTGALHDRSDNLVVSMLIRLRLVCQGRPDW